MRRRYRSRFKRRHSFRRRGGRRHIRRRRRVGHRRPGIIGWRM